MKRRGKRKRENRALYIIKRKNKRFGSKFKSIKIAFAAPNLHCAQV